MAANTTAMKSPQPPGQAPGCWNYPIHSVGVLRKAIGAGAEVHTELAVNQPLSHILITLKAVYSGAGALPTSQTMLSQISNITFSYRGVSIWSLNAEDTHSMTRAAVKKSTVTLTNTTTLTTTLLIPFTRHLFSPYECFPRVESGDTELIITFPAVAATLTSRTLTTQFVQLPMATPETFLRCTTYRGTAGATGDLDIDLPRAAPLAGIGLRETTTLVPGGTQDGISSVKLLVNGIDTWYPSASFDALRYMSWWGHAYGYDEDTSPADAGLTQLYLTTSSNTNFGYIDLDPTHDSMYALQAQNCNTLQLRLNMAVAEAFRVLPLEIWQPNMILPMGCSK